MFPRGTRAKREKARLLGEQPDLFLGMGMLENRTRSYSNYTTYWGMSRENYYE